MNTILQQRIEEAAKKYCQDKNYILPDDTELSLEALTAIDAYIEAAKSILKNQWISVEEALPEIVDGYRSALVIVRSKYNSYDVAKWDEYYKDWMTPDTAVANITHWMPIPELKGGMKIKFETEDECYCVTPCPYGFTDGYTGEPKKVGSNGCSECIHFKNIDTENDTIECDFKD